MSTPDVFVVKTAVFTKTGGTPLTITGLTDVSTPENGNVTILESDANSSPTGVYVDGIGSAPTLSTVDILQATHADLAVGTAGALVITYQRRAQGKGAPATTPNRVCTYAAVVVTSRDPKANTTGKGDASVSFQAYAATAGDDKVCTWTTT
jgi:hypothetical protein